MAHICQHLAALTARRPGPLFHDAQVSMGAGELAARVAALAAGLQAAGLRAGDLVALAAQNGLPFVEALLAVTAAGGVAVLLHWRDGAADLARALGRVRPRLLLLDARLSPALHALASHAELGAFALGREGASSGLQPAEELVRQHRGAQLRWEHGPEGAAVTCFTSGITGTPKAVLLSHTALCFQALAKLLEVGYTAADVYLHTAPLCHVGGLSSLLAALATGCTQVFTPAFKPAAALQLLAEHSVTAFIAVPAMASDLVEVHDLASTGPLHSVRRILLGGGPLPEATATRLQTLFPAALLYTAYGMSEACSSITFQRLGEDAPSGAGRGTCVGRPPPGVLVRVAQPLGQGQEGSGEQPGAAAAPGLSTGDEEAGGGVAGQAQGSAGGDGEVLTAGPHLFLRYWGDPAATAAARAPGGWLRTGDLGRLDAGGRLWLTGRRGDVVRSGAESVPAAEVEAALRGHPGVRAAAVAGVPDPRLGERVAALLVLAPGWEWRGSGAGAGEGGAGGGVLTLSALRQALAGAGLPAYKHPRLVGVAAELPLTAAGKVAKQAVRDRLAALQAGSHAHSSKL